MTEKLQNCKLNFEKNVSVVTLFPHYPINYYEALVIFLFSVIVSFSSFFISMVNIKKTNKSRAAFGKFKHMYVSLSVIFHCVLKERYMTNLFFQS